MDDIRLTRIDDDKNMRRFYAVGIGHDLFGSAVVVRRWGRIGTPGRERVEVYSKEDAALQACTSVVEGKRRRGYR